MKSLYENKIYQLLFLLSLFCCLFFAACSFSPIQQDQAFQQDVSAVRDSLSTLSRGEHTQIRLSYPVHPQMVVGFERESDDSMQKLFENTEFFSFPVHSGEITAMAMAADGSGVFTAGIDGKVVFSRLAPGLLSNGAKLEVEDLMLSTRAILAVSPSPDGRYLAVGQFSSVSIFDLQKKQVIAEITRVEGRITALAWDPKGGFLAMGRASGDIFLWEPYDDDWSQAQDRVDVLENYSGAISPIVKLIFHPAGRVLFAAERGGVVSAWRILRTERQMGLRDDNAIRDLRKEGRYRQVLTAKGEQIEDMRLVDSSEAIAVSTTNGNIFWWQIRGLMAEKTINAAPNESVLGFVQIPIAPINSVKGLVVGVSRNQKVRAWCDLIPNKTDINIASSAASGDSQAVASVTGALVQKSQDILLNESQVFQSPLSDIAFDSARGILWLAQKTGNLLVFDVEMLKNSAAQCTKKFFVN